MGDYRLPPYALTAGKKYFVTVCGWVMLKHVDAGNYRIELVDRGGWFGVCANFYRPRGKKIIACHNVGNLFLEYFGDTDLNKIVVTGEA